MTPEERIIYQRARKARNSAARYARMRAAGIKQKRTPRKPKEPKPRVPRVVKPKLRCESKKAIQLREKFKAWRAKKISENNSLLLLFSPPVSTPSPDNQTNQTTQIK